MMASVECMRPESRPGSYIKGGKACSDTRWPPAELADNGAITANRVQQNSQPPSGLEVETDADRLPCVFRGKVANDRNTRFRRFLFWQWVVTEFQGAKLSRCPLEGCTFELTQKNLYNHIFSCRKLHTGSYHCPSHNKTESFADFRGRTREALCTLQHAFKCLCKLGRIDTAFRVILPKIVENYFRKHEATEIGKTRISVSEVSVDESTVRPPHKELYGSKCQLEAQHSSKTSLVELEPLGDLSVPIEFYAPRPESQLMPWPNNSVIPELHATPLLDQKLLLPQDHLCSSNQEYEMVSTENSSPVSTSSDNTLIGTIDSSESSNTPTSMTFDIKLDFSPRCDFECTVGSAPPSSTMAPIDHEDESDRTESLKYILLALVNPLDKSQDSSNLEKLEVLGRLELSTHSSVDIFIEGAEYIMWYDNRSPQTARRQFCMLITEFASALVCQVSLEYVKKDIMERISASVNFFDSQEEELFRTAFDTFISDWLHRPHSRVSDHHDSLTIDAYTSQGCSAYRYQSQECMYPRVPYFYNFLEFFQYIHMKDPRELSLFELCEESFFNTYYEGGNKVLKALEYDSQFEVFRPLILDMYSNLGKIHCLCQLQLNLIMEGRNQQSKLGLSEETYITFSEKVRELCCVNDDRHEDHRKICLRFAARGLGLKLKCIEILDHHDTLTESSDMESNESIAPTECDLLDYVHYEPWAKSTPSGEITLEDKSRSWAPVTETEFRCRKCGKCFRGRPKNARANLKRHMKETHDHLHPKSYCPIDGCNKSFNRRSNMAQHIRERHVEAGEGEDNKPFSRRSNVAQHIKGRLMEESREKKRSYRKRGSREVKREETGGSR